MEADIALSGKRPVSDRARHFAFPVVWVFAFSIPWENIVRIGEFATISRGIGVLALVLALGQVLSTGLVRRPGIFLGLTSVFVLWAALTFLWTDYPAYTERRVFQFVQLLGLSLVVWLCAKTPHEVRQLLLAYVSGCSVSAVSTVWNYASGNAIQNIRYVATGFDPNELGLTLALAIPLAWGLASTTSAAPLRWIIYTYLPLGALAILLTGSRGALLSSLAAVTIAIWHFPRAKLSQKVASFIMLGLAIGAALMIVPPELWQRLSRVATELQGGNLTRRTEIWAAGWTVFLEHPVLGVGAGAFAPAIRPAYGTEIVAHNTFLSVLVEQGVVGAFLFVSICVSVLAGAWKLPSPWRATWITVAATWTIGVSSLTWEHRKPTWLLLACLAVHIEASRRSFPPFSPKDTAQLREPRWREMVWVKRAGNRCE